MIHRNAERRSLLFHFLLSWKSWTMYLLTSVLWLFSLSYLATAATTAHWVEWQRIQRLRLVRSTAHSFACSALLARSAALIRSLARSLNHSGPHGREVFVHRTNASISYNLNPLCNVGCSFFYLQVESVGGEGVELFSRIWPEPEEHLKTNCKNSISNYSLCFMDNHTKCTGFIKNAN